jgi:ubiquinone/menaquinone biosynthesis C-methylase UbiE
MSLTKFIRQMFPEGIPAPGAIIYNALPAKLLKEPERKIAKDVVDRIESGTLIDLGSGTGYLATEIAKRAPKLKVYGIDLSKQMVKIAKKHAEGIRNVQFEVENAAELPFEDDSIDFIVSTGSLHHWRKPVKVFDECYRVLRSGKEAWIYDGCPDVLKEEVHKIKKEYGFLRYRILIKVLAVHGFTSEEYASRIRNILEQTRFKDSYEMEQTEIWMKIIGKKYA